jgi:ABC-type branched-subunit amino acid transport system ATPase component
VALDVADRAVVLRGGRVVASGASAALRAHRAVLEASYLGDT